MSALGMSSMIVKAYNWTYKMSDADERKWTRKNTIDNNNNDDDDPIQQ